MTVEEIDKEYNWSDWLPFPNPFNNDYLNAPLGPGIYQIRTKNTHDYIMSGESEETLLRMLSLFPKPFYKGNRDSKVKRDYIQDNIDDIEYRTVACSSKEEAVEIKNKLKSLNIHAFNT